MRSPKRSEMNLAPSAGHALDDVTTSSLPILVYDQSALWGSSEDQLSRITLVAKLRKHKTTLMNEPKKPRFMTLRRCIIELDMMECPYEAVSGVTSSHISPISPLLVSSKLFVRTERTFLWPIVVVAWPSGGRAARYGARGNRRKHLSVL